MVTTKRVKSSGKKVGKGKTWSIGAIFVALIGTFLLLVSGFSRPQDDILGHTVVLTQGLVLPAVVLGAIVWGLVELFTPPARNITDLLIRIIPAFIAGAFLGGLLGYLLNFGGYVLNPAFNGNIPDLFFLVSAIIAGLAITWNAAWADTHGFRGQKKGFTVLQRKESGTSKAKRFIVALLAIFLVLLVLLPISAGIGQEMVSAHDNSVTLLPQSQTTYISTSNGTGVPFASRVIVPRTGPVGIAVAPSVTDLSGSYTITDFSFPTVTKDNVTTTIHTLYIRTNLTLGEMNNFAVSKIVLFTGTNLTLNVTLGTGLNGTDFSPFSFVSGNTTFNCNTTSCIPTIGGLAIALAPYELTGNQTMPVEMKLTANVSNMHLIIQTYGNNGLVTIFGPYSVLQFSSILGGVVMLAFAFYGISSYDISVDLFKGSNPNHRTYKRGGGKR
ncbi:MAG: hypothetical protein ACYCSO_05115 [Cuniculiplasma sp.]